MIMVIMQGYNDNGDNGDNAGIRGHLEASQRLCAEQAAGVFQFFL